MTTTNAAGVVEWSDDVENMMPSSLSSSMMTPPRVNRRLVLSNYVGDRFIPCRNTDNWDIQFNINDMNKDITMYKAVLRNELLGTRIDGLHQNGASNGSGMFSSGGGGSAAGSQNTAATNGLNLPIAGVGPVAGNAAVAANTIPAQVNNFIGANASMQTGAHTVNTNNVNTTNINMGTQTGMMTTSHHHHHHHHHHHSSMLPSTIGSSGGGGATPNRAVSTSAGGVSSPAASSGASGTPGVGGSSTLVSSSSHSSILQSRDMSSVFQYNMTTKSPSTPFKTIDTNNYAHYSPYSLSPLSPYSQKLLRSPRRPIRKIPKVPFKVLDAPELQDDFYLNLVDWSSTNVLGVGLGTSVYLWSACTSQVTKLCDLSSREDSVSSVAWSEKGNYIAVGTFKGDVQIWDAGAAKLLNTLPGHSARVGALAWNHDLLCSGSRDRNVFLRDIRAPSYEGERKLTGHKQEVCGLKWSPDHLLLASGGNDNKLLVWNVNGGNTPIQTYNDHIAAVKAIAWSPHQHGLLASGGGTADRCIRFWNTLTGQNLQSVDTGSQVCNLAWSKHSNELVSTHGYSQNQILIWKYPMMTQLAKLTGHSYRVLYLAVSPDGEAIVTGAGDETLRFWNVFSKSRHTKESKSVLNLFAKIR